MPRPGDRGQAGTSPCVPIVANQDSDTDDGEAAKGRDLIAWGVAISLRSALRAILLYLFLATETDDQGSLFYLLLERC